MNNLLDTHTLIWFITGDASLSDTARKEIDTTKGANFISIASFWEMAIKIGYGKLELGTSFEVFIEVILKNSFRILPITTIDTITISSLPLHHRDPFDRMMIAQAQNLDLQIITKDDVFKHYNVSVLW
jgi:PIN domain nuclease of toxin-antitoxin system